MGMDAWIMAKTTVREKKEQTTVCGGLFGIIPKAISEDVELGYMRYGYEQHAFIKSNTGREFDEEYNLYISKAEIEAIMYKIHMILQVHIFDEDGVDLTLAKYGIKSYEGNIKRYNTILNAFSEALIILEEDKNAKIYYHAWY